MNLSAIQDILMIPLTEEDLFPVFKTLWVLRDTKEEKGLIEAVIRSVMGDEVFLPGKATMNSMMIHSATYREEYQYQKTQTPKRIDERLYAFSQYLEHEVRINEAIVEKLRLEALSLENPDAIYDIMKWYSKNKSQSMEERLEAIHSSMKDDPRRYGLLVDILSEKRKDEEYEKTLMDGVLVNDPHCCFLKSQDLRWKGDYKGMDYYLERGKYDSPEAMFQYGLSFLVPMFHHIDKGRAKTEVMKAAFAGCGEASDHLARSNLYGICYCDKPNYDKALYFFSLGMEQGYRDSEFTLAEMMNGRFSAVPEEFINHEKAAKGYLSMAKNGDTRAKLRYADLLMEGKYGVEKDVERAKQLYKEVIQERNAYASAILGPRMYRKKQEGTEEEMVSLLCSGMLCDYPDYQGDTYDCLQEYLKQKGMLELSEALKETYEGKDYFKTLPDLKKAVKKIEEACNGH